MLRSLKDIERYTVSAKDGDIGNVENFVLDDVRWIVRYLVVETGGFLDRQQVLISPLSFGNVDWATRRFHLTVTKDKVRTSPSLDTDKPVSREYESECCRHYNHSEYWQYSGVWGTGPFPGLFAANTWNEATGEHLTKADAVHLRSAKELRGYRIQGTDEVLGHVDDFIVDDQTWEVRYLVLDTGNWWSGKKVLVSPHWASRVSWTESMVYVTLSRDAVQKSPEWNASTPVNREYEARLYDYYGRPAYWDNNGQPLL